MNTLKKKYKTINEIKTIPINETKKQLKLKYNKKHKLN